MTSQQAPLTHQPGEGGLWRKVLDGNTVNHSAWLRARAEGSFVGNCRRCGDYLIPAEPQQRGSGFDYAAYCRQTDTCRYELAAPGGRVLRRSTCLSEQPKGA